MGARATRCATRSRRARVSRTPSRVLDRPILRRQPRPEAYAGAGGVLEVGELGGEDGLGRRRVGAVGGLDRHRHHLRRGRVGVDEGGDRAVGRPEAVRADRLPVLDQPELEDVALAGVGRSFPHRKTPDSPGVYAIATSPEPPSKVTSIVGTVWLSPDRATSTNARINAIAAATPNAVHHRGAARPDARRDRPARDGAGGGSLGSATIRSTSGIHRPGLERERVSSATSACSIGGAGTVEPPRAATSARSAGVVVEPVQRPDGEQLVDQRRPRVIAPVPPARRVEPADPEQGRDFKVERQSVRPATRDRESPSGHIRCITSRCSAGSSASARTDDGVGRAAGRPRRGRRRSGRPRRRDRGRRLAPRADVAPAPGARRRPPDGGRANSTTNGPNLVFDRTAPGSARRRGRLPARSSATCACRTNRNASALATAAC